MWPYAKAQPFSKLLVFSSMNMKVQCIDDLSNEPYQATLKRDFQLQTHILIAVWELNVYQIIRDRHSS